MTPNKSIVLVGLMGTGKSRVGRALAKKLAVEFWDSDQEIERASGYTISDFFKRFGEPAFRDGEAKVIERLLRQPPSVIATGGGAYTSDPVRHLCRQKAVTVWLQASVPVLVERTGRTQHRPLLKTGDPADILAAMNQKRSPLYAQADIHLNTDSQPVEAVVDMIVAALKGHDQSAGS